MLDMLLFFALYLFQEEGEECEGVHAVRPHLCLSSLKGVSPGGVFERGREQHRTFSNREPRLSLACTVTREFSAHKK